MTIKIKVYEAVQSANALESNGLDRLPCSLPSDFDFSQIRTVDDAQTLICRMRKSQRGIAAKGLYEHRRIVGKRVAYRALIDCWLHNHGELISAFGSLEALVAALRDVSPPAKRKEPIRAWRGIQDVSAALGMSWTTDRDLACWFAMRHFDSKFRPAVLVCDLYPEAIITECNGRSEHELIVDPIELEKHWIFLDDGRENPHEIDDLYDEDYYREVAPNAADWRSGFDRYETASKKRYRGGSAVEHPRAEPCTPPRAPAASVNEKQLIRS